VLGDAPGLNPEVIFIATGSEVSLAVDADEKLVADGIRSRVVSMPSWEIFERQPQEYRDSVLPPEVKARVAVEQGSTFGWERYVGTEGCVIVNQREVLHLWIGDVAAQITEKLAEKYPGHDLARVADALVNRLTQSQSHCHTLKPDEEPKHTRGIRI